MKFVLPIAAGSATDTIGRVLANKLGKTWDQPVVVENMPGAGLNLGATHVARSAPDGYTLLLAPMPPLTVNHLLYRDLQYQPSQFVPISMLVQVPNALSIRQRPSRQHGPGVRRLRQVPAGQAQLTARKASAPAHI